jgi:hypothetical protein
VPGEEPRGVGPDARGRPGDDRYPLHAFAVSQRDAVRPRLSTAVAVRR